MSDPTASTSNLQISVEPSQSSFFAGEEFSCVITFTNTLIPVPQSAPLPSSSVFEGVQDFDRRVASFNPNALPTSGPSTLTPLKSKHSPSASLLGPPHRRKHSKSQSVDIRTFARQNQLQPFGGGEEEPGSDERYYRDVAEEKEKEIEGWETGSFQREMLENLPSRKKLIGKSLGYSLDVESGNGSMNTAGTSTPSKRHHKAFSVSASGQYNQHQNLGMGRPTLVPGFSDSPRGVSQHISLQANAPSPAASRNVSSATRQPSGPIASNHPHSRKKSVAQVQAEDLSATFELEGGGSTGADSTPTQSALATPRESLDLRSRGNENSHNFYGLGENSTMESVLREDFTEWSKMGVSGTRNRSDSISSSTAGTQRKIDSNGTPVTPLFDVKGGSVPGTETLLWTFAQFGGSFQIDESLIKPGEFEQVKEKLAGVGGVPNVIGSNLPLSPVGGGEFGVSSDGGEDRNVQGWGSYLRGVLSGGGGGKRSSLSAAAVTAAHRRSGSTLGDMRAKTLTSKSIPVFSNPPSMIAVDLKLAPGESRSYTFRIPLPPDLPPSYTGRSISFVYTLTLGTNRLVKTKRGTIEQKSRLVRIPLRVYNLVSISGITSFFDLTNPIVNLKDVAEIKEEDFALEEKLISTPIKSPSNSPTSMNNRRGSSTNVKEDASSKALIQYTQHLIASCKEEEEDDVPTDVEVATELARKQGLDRDGASPIKRNHLQLLPDIIAIKTATSTRPLDSKAGLGLMGEEDDLPKNSLQAVEVLSRNSQKVSYDISKDGQVAAVLTLIKSKYRLGDTVNGVVTINNSISTTRVVRIAATLETHEEIESTLCTLPATRAQKMTRKVHSEFHEDTLDTGQVCFSLPIPSGATPDFVTSAVKLSWTVRMSFLMLSTVRQSNNEENQRQKPPTHLIPSIDDGFSTYHHAFRATPALSGPTSIGQSLNQLNEAKLEVVECAVPLTILAHSTRFTAGEVAFIA